MEADSGAAISVMSVNNFNNLKLYDYSTRKTDDMVRSVTGTEKVHSIVTVPVTVHGETYQLDLRLLDTSCPNLYGRCANIELYQIIICCIYVVLSCY